MKGKSPVGVHPAFVQWALWGKEYERIAVGYAVVEEKTYSHSKLVGVVVSALSGAVQKHYKWQTVSNLGCISIGRFGHFGAV